VKRIPARFARVLLLCLLFPAAALVIGASAAGEESKALRVCADPDNLPFSDRQEQGFENRIAALVAEDMGVPVSYFWWPHRRGFLRNTIRANECDVLMGVPEGMDAVLATRPYYRSAFQFVTRVDRDLDLGSLDDPRLRQLKIGVNMIGYEYNNSPAARALGARGIVGLVGFPTFYNEENRPAGIVEAVTEGKIDVAIVWGPVAGYFAKQQEVPLALAPLPDVDVRTRTPFAFSFVVGVRKSEKALAERIQQALDHKQEDIQKILREYGVPIGAPAAAPRGRKHTDAAGPAPAGTLAVASHEEQHADKLLATPDEYQGWKWFHVYCFRCHGIDALGSDLAPNLLKSVSAEGLVTRESFLSTVRDGRQEKGMQSWKELLDDPQIEQLYAYLKARSEGRLAAGRPHRAAAK